MRSARLGGFVVHHGADQVDDPATQPAVFQARWRRGVVRIADVRGQRELRIRHGNEIYRLRHTRNDKLILTK